MTTIELLSGIICLKHGDKVSDQFVDVYENDEPLDEQNKVALRYILLTLKEVAESDLITDVEMLDGIITEISDFLNKQ